MDIFEKNNLGYSILKKIRDAFRLMIDNGSLQNVRWKELEKNLKPILIKIKK